MFLYRLLSFPFAFRSGVPEHNKHVATLEYSDCRKRCLNSRRCRGTRPLWTLSSASQHRLVIWAPHCEVCVAWSLRNNRTLGVFPWAWCETVRPPERRQTPRCASWPSRLFIRNTACGSEKCTACRFEFLNVFECIRMMEWLKPQLSRNDYSTHLIWLWHHSVCVTSCPHAAISLLTSSWSRQGIKLLFGNCKYPSDYLHMQYFPALYVGTTVTMWSANFSFVHFEITAKKNQPKNIPPRYI